MVAVLAFALVWRRLLGLKQENELMLRLGIATSTLARQWLREVQLGMLVPALWLGVVLFRLLAESSARWFIATGPLVAIPGCVALACWWILELHASRALRAMFVLGGLLGLIVMVLVFAGPVVGWSLAWLAIATPWASTRRLGRELRPLLQKGRRFSEAQRRPFDFVAWLVRPLPRKVGALVCNDLRRIARGAHPRGRLAAVPLFMLPIVYLAWPLPADIPQAPLVAMGMLATFGLAAVAFVFGADLELAERPFRAQRRVQPCSPSVVWISRQLVVALAGLLWAFVLAIAVVIRHREAALAMLPALAVLALIVPAYTAALGQAAGSGGGAAASEAALASALASSAAVVGLAVLIAAVVMPALLLLSPLLLIKPYYQHRRRFWREELR
jgi:hypothetical protein